MRGMKWFFSLIGSILLLSAGSFFYLYRSNTPSTNAVPGTCKILEEKFCKNVKFVTLTSNHLVFAAYAIPAGTTLFSPEAYEYLQTFSNVVFFGDTKKLTATTSFGHVQSDQNITANELNITFYTHNSLSNIQKDSSGSIQQTGIKNDKIGQLASSDPVIKELPYTLLVLVRQNTFPVIHPAPLNFHPTSTNITESFLQE